MIAPAHRFVASIWIALIAIALALVSIFLTTHDAQTRAVSQETSRAEQVVDRGELRVGYIVFPPYIAKNSQTGEITGIFATLTNELGRSLGVKVTWVEEVSLSSLAVGFQANRIDMIATPLWRSAERAKVVDFSVPLFYSVVGTYVREGDTRFDRDISILDSPNIRVAALDGEMAGQIAASDFPKAKVQSLPQIADYSQLLLEVASGKADVTFYNRLFANRYMRANPGAIRELNPNRPIRVFAECFVLPAGDPRFTEMINNSLSELLDNGGLERALAANGENPNEYHLRARPYQQPAAESVNAP